MDAFRVIDKTGGDVAADIHEGCFGMVAKTSVGLTVLILIFLCLH